MPTVTVCTQVYNTREYLAQCVESVLNQTFQDFEYLIIDNGCTDGSQGMLRRYAAQDNRIKLIRYETNIARCRWLEPTQKQGLGRYFANLDSDDWWEPNYLEKLLAFAEDNDLDIACTGTVMHVTTTGMQSPRKVDRPLILPREMFAESLPGYHVFLRPVWGKLIRMEHLRTVPLEMMLLPYGADTLLCFHSLRHSRRLGIDSTALQHYRIISKSNSYQYDPKRFFSDVYLYNDAIDFLTAFGPVSTRNRNFLQAVYSNAVSDTTGVIQNAALSPADKLREYHTIASHPITLATYRECTDESAERSRTNLLVRALEAGAALGKQDDSDLRTAMQLLLPRCGRAVSAANAGLFLEDRQLLQMLLRDDADAVLNIILERLRSNQGVKKYALPETVQALAADNPLLCRINDAVFLRKYGELYEKVWKGECLDALDEMAGLLMDGKVSGGRETFLELFISLAATENQIPAFIIGKMQLADLYFRQNRREECRSIILDLTEMGVENDELSGLRQKLETQ